MQDRFQLTQNGQELQQSDVNLVAKVASIADERVFQEMLKMQGFGTNADGKAIKAIIPGVATIVTGNGATGQVEVGSFRAIVGSRQSISGGATARDFYEDIRTRTFIASDAAVAINLSLAANSSGNPRWDLVYCRVDVDANSASVIRQVKSPTTSVVTPTSVVITLATNLVAGVVTGTPSGTPVLPSLPTDAAGSYYIPLAYVRVPTGFTAGSTVATTDIM